MKKLTFALLFTGSLFAQTYSYSFTAPVGAITCSHVSPYIQHYQYLVENSTPPYPAFGIPPEPNHPYPVANGICPLMSGFVSTSGVTANLNVWQIRTSAGQVVYLSNIIWTTPQMYPAENESVSFSMDATITQVCNAICGAASGNVHLEGQWAFKWVQSPVYKWVYVFKEWTNTSPVVIDGQSTVAI